MGDKLLILILVIGLVLAGWGLFYVSRQESSVPPESTGQTSQKEANIRVFEPTAGQEVGLPLVVKGEARVFENTFQYRLRDEDGSILVERHDMANAPDVGFFGPFNVETSYPEPKGVRGTVEVFDYSAKDGSEENMVRIPVRFKKVDSQIVKIYMSDRNKDPDALDCGVTYPVLRRIPKTEGVARAALAELLRGPSNDEGREGFFSSINSGVVLNSLTIQNGVARADFDEMLGLGVGGSCRVAAIRSQIENTLKQFPTVREVKISINGREDDILQP